MNKIYKVIWSKVRNCYVTVSEIAKRNGKGGAAALALAALCAVPGHAMANSGGEVNGAYYIGKQPDYTVVIDEGFNGSVFGRYYTGDTAGENATVEIRDGLVEAYVAGSYSYSGNVTGNTVNVTGGTVVHFVYGGLTHSGSAGGAGEGEGNVVHMTGGTVGYFVYGGFTISGSATGNTVSINQDDSNIATSISGNVYGGCSSSGNATGNTVNVTGGTVDGSVFGGKSASGSATDNTVILSKQEGKAPPELKGTVYGGVYDSGDGDCVTGNTLQVEAAGLSAPEIQNFEKYSFVLPDSISAGDTMLTLTAQNAGLTIDGSKVSVSVASGTQPGTGLRLNDNVTLLNQSGGNGTFFVSNISTSVIERLDGAEDGLTKNVFSLSKPDGANKLNATFTEHYLYGDGGSYMTGSRLLDNTLTIADGEKATAAFGGRTNDNVSSAMGNEVTMTGGELVKLTDDTNPNYGISGNLYGGYAAGYNNDCYAMDNTVKISGGTIGRAVYGGYSKYGDATGNTVDISGGTIGEVVYGEEGYGGAVYGGYSEGGKATGNTVVLGEGLTDKTFGGLQLYGGRADGGGDAVSGNTLQVEGRNIQIYSVSHFDNYKFILPQSVKSGDTILGFRGYDGDVIIDGGKVSVYSGGRLGLNLGESVTLLKDTVPNRLAGGSEFILNNADKLPVFTERLDNEETGFVTLTGKTEKPDRERELNLTITGKYLYGDGGTNTPGQREKDNTLYIETGTNATAAYGGRATDADVTGNTVNMTGGTVGDVYGGYSGCGNATGNTVRISGGTVEQSVVGGSSEDGGSATGNTVILSKQEGEAAPVLSGTVYGGNGYRNAVTGNTLQLESTGLSAKGIQNFETIRLAGTLAWKNGATVLKAGEFKDNTTTDESKKRASLDITAAETNLAKAAVGQMTLLASDTAEDFKTLSLIYSGGTEALSETNLSKVVTSNKNVLEMTPAKGVTITTSNTHMVSLDKDNDYKNVLYTVTNITSKITLGNIDWQKDATLLDRSSAGYNYAAVTSLGTDKFAVTYDKPETVAAGDSMTLLKANKTLADMAAQTKTNAYEYEPVTGVKVNATITGSLAAKGGAVTYRVEENKAGKLTFTDVDWKDSGALLTRPTNIVFAGADVDTAKIHFKNIESLQAKKKMTLVSDFGDSVGTITGNKYTVGTGLEGEGAASLAGSDLIFTAKTGTGNLQPQEQAHKTVMAMEAGIAMLAAGSEHVGMALGGLAAQGNEAPDGASTFASVGGGSSRYETGSHVNTNTWNALVAVGGKKETEKGSLQYGLFGEYGKGNYTLHSNAGRGDGDAHYAGGGLLAKWMNRHNVYAEASFRLGRMSDSASDILHDAAGNGYGYDVHANYFGAHVGIGKVFHYTGGRSLDVYGKYFYTKRDGVNYTAGGSAYNLDSVASSVLRVGARYGSTDRKWNWYGGLAFDYEFDGEATGKVDGVAIRSASVKGGSVRGELGLRMDATKDNPWKADITVYGYGGKHRGFGGNVSLAYMF